MEFDFARLIYLLMILSFLIWQLVVRKPFTPKIDKKKRLIHLLDKAEVVLSKYSGGYSGEFLSAEEFHQNLKNSIQEYKNGDIKKLDSFQIWFAPTCEWDDFVGKEGISLGNEIYELILSIKEE